MQVHDLFYVGVDGTAFYILCIIHIHTRVCVCVHESECVCACVSTSVYACMCELMLVFGHV